MKCSFVDTGTGREQKVDLSPAPKETDGGGVDKFMVE